MVVHLPGTTGEPLSLCDALRDDPERMRGVTVLGCFVPGMNEFDYAGLDPGGRVTTFMLPRAMRRSFAAGRVDLVPRSYTGAAAYLGRARCDVAIAHVAVPGADGLCSYGIASDFTPLVWPRAAFRIALVNPAMPAMARGPRLRLADADLVIEAEAPLTTAPPARPEEGAADRIARAVAGLIPDGAHVQTGIGGAPGAIWRHLTLHRGLVLRSGMVNDWLRDLADAGALTGDSGHTAGIAYGSDELYRWLAETDLVRFASTPETHGIGALAGIERLHAVNSALEVDLFGQVNVEWTGGQLASGVGGAIDFARAAIASPGGRSIVALPATAKGGAISRIVARLSAPSIGIARTDIDTVVTEHGVAAIRELPLDARAEALIAIAAPTFRDDLAEAWRALRARF